MIKGNRELILFTRAFPYGKEETFLETEILKLSAYFEQIIIVPLEKQNNLKRNVPKNVEIRSPVFEERNLLYLFKQLWLILTKSFFLSQIFKQKFNLKTVKQLFIIAQFQLYLQRNKIPDNQNTTWYFYWGVNHTNYLAFFKPLSKTLARFHRYDLYEGEGSIPFRKELFNNLNSIVCISQHGADYISKKYPQFKNKISVFKLGTLDMGNKVEYDRSLKTYKIVSCSNVIPVKRVYLIAEALKSVTLNVEWTHFGEGKDFESLKSQVSSLPSNVKYNFPGRVSNSEVLRYYNSNDVHLFMNVSSSEGIPVSIMEAISFGIPVIATDVDGNGEIVSSRLGSLIPKDATPSELASQIQVILLSPDYSKLREAARMKWQDEYSADNNYEKFCKFLVTDSP